MGVIAQSRKKGLLSREVADIMRDLEHLVVERVRRSFDIQASVIKTLFIRVKILQLLLAKSTPKIHAIPGFAEGEASYPPNEYITSLFTYKIRSPDQGYYHDRQTIGPVYRRFIRHKSALQALSKTLAQQKTPPKNGRIWENEMEHLSAKLLGWNMEMKWTKAAFTKGDPHVQYEL
ncbi:MAG: hypothetical protein Q9168_003568 [Polycauliona sp. 1 TL-2023]